MSLQGNVYKFASGLTIPAVAYGAGTKWFKMGTTDISEPLIESSKYALTHGFKHIDGALVYGTDVEVGKAISAVDRSTIFVTNKYFPSLPIMKTPYGNPIVSLREQLKALQTDHVDLYLLHHPFIDKNTDGFDLVEAWKFMEQAVEEGLTKYIGVSNFAVEDLKLILDNSRVKPVVNQIEFNAYLQNQTPGIVKFCQENDILVLGYSPLAPLFLAEKGELNDYLDELSKKYSKSPAQLLLRWVLQNGVLPVTTSGNEERIVQFNDLFNFELTSEEFSKITEIGKSHPTLRKYWKEEYGKFN